MLCNMIAESKTKRRRKVRHRLYHHEAILYLCAILCSISNNLNTVGQFFQTFSVCRWPFRSLLGCCSGVLSFSSFMTWILTSPIRSPILSQAVTMYRKTTISAITSSGRSKRPALAKINSCLYRLEFYYLLCVNKYIEGFVIIKTAGTQFVSLTELSRGTQNLPTSYRRHSRCVCISR